MWTNAAAPPPTNDQGKERDDDDDDDDAEERVGRNSNPPWLLYETTLLHRQVVIGHRVVFGLCGTVCGSQAQQVKWTEESSAVIGTKNTSRY